jgi:non-heme chloroperoxidase
MGFYVTVEEDVNIFVEDIDPGNTKKTILFIHGWPVNHKQFEYQFNELPQLGYRCIAMDLRGFGKSDRPWNDYSYGRIADDIRIIIDTLRLENIILVGFSMGGAIAIRYMARHSGWKVEKLILMGAAAPLFTRRPDYPYGFTKEEVNDLIIQTYKDRPQMLSGFGDIFFARYVTCSFKEWFQGMGLEASGHATAMTLVSLRDEDLKEDLSKVNVPTAIFHGVQDKICPFVFAEKMNQELTRFIG